MRFLLTTLFIISFLSGWFLHSVFTPMSSCDFALIDSDVQEEKSFRNKRRTPASVKVADTPSVNKNINEISITEDIEKNIYVEFKDKLVKYSSARNYEDKRILIVNAMETQIIEQDIINQIIEDEFQVYLDTGEYPPTGYFEEILESIPDDSNKRKIYYSLKFNESRNDIPRERLDTFRSYFH